MPKLPILPERYELWPKPERALIGKGGAGEVWRARDQELGVLVAMKVLRTEGARVAARLEREAALSARIVHPNVVALHDLGTTPDGHPYLAFALASDGSMLDLVGRPPPWGELRELLLGLLSALSALHSRGLLHLDVKLSNLLLHRAGPHHRDLWLADMGVARALHADEDDDQGVVGTVSYMAPERLTGQRELWCPATDLFSVGAVAYRLIAGQLPFKPRDPAEALAARRTPPRKIPVLSGYEVPHGTDEVVLAMLQFDPRGRFDLAADAIRALRALSDVPRGRVTTAPGAPNPAGAPTGSYLSGVPWHRPYTGVLPRTLPRRPKPRRVPQATSLMFHREIQLTGRDKELDLMWREARAVMRHERPTILHVRGPRGIGRTRLVQEFTRAVEEAGFGEGVLMEYAVREGPALGMRGAWRRHAPPVSDRNLHIQQTSVMLARDSGKPLATVYGQARALVNWLSPASGGALPDRRLIQGMLVDHLDHRSWRGISWLLLEDVHLAPEDDDAWSILDMVFSRNTPVLVLITSRDDAVVPALDDIKARHPRSVKTIELEPLRSAAASALVHAHLPVDAQLTRQLARHTRGNPRHLRELLLHLARLGALEQKRGQDAHELVWTLRDDAPPLPADRYEFARVRLAHALDKTPGALGALLTVALAGRGTPERVVARVAGEMLDRLVVEGLVVLERGMPVLNPPELPEAIRAWPREEGLDAFLHEHLAAAWAQEGEDPAVLARVGVHRALAGLHQSALEPLDRALRAMKRSLPVDQVLDLATRTMEVAELTVGRRSPVWAHAAMARSQALWLRREREAALELDEAVARLSIPAEDAVLAACQHANHLGRRVGGGKGLARLERVTHLIDKVRPSTRAAFYSARAAQKVWEEETEGTLRDLDDVLASSPDPEVEVHSRILKAMVLEPSDPQGCYDEALRAIEVARANGLIRYEAQAWGVAAHQMVRLQRADEAVERLKAAIARLEAHGDYEMAATLFNSLGETLRAAGRLEEATKAYASIADEQRLHDTVTSSLAHGNLAILAALQADGEAMARHVRAPHGDDPVVVHAWALLEPVAGLLIGARGPLPDAGSVHQGVRLGPDGIFLVGAIIELLRRKGDAASAQRIAGWLDDACQREGVDPACADAMIERFQAALGR